ncbi:DUF1735 domain-containing protein [Chitinophaga japonensis]|uniref:Uncharacterized protein DUF1735 n=1 Tax=Chitinophaga japonensis TaxID=104662 RepID=A0A562T3W1_CHIJA|nr:DUF1735 domain-containing protein [Chitinophaga japonensis]TWI87934.1 uncharacterized protein DUF1735 [Chitinophaga japonensis]
MKHIIKKASLALVTLAFTSCLKDHLAVDPAQSNNVIEFANTGSIASPAGAIHPRYAIDLGSLEVGQSAQFNVNLSYSGPEATAPQDITVILEVDEAAVAAYNAEQDGVDYTMATADMFEFPATAVIKKGEQRAQVQVTFTRTTEFDFDLNYAVPLKIASVSSGIISGNFGIALYSVAARNEYDGVYEMTGTMVDATSASLTGWYPLDMDLVTYTGNSIALYDNGNYVREYAHPIRSGTGGSYYGSYSPVFFFDTDGNVTEVVNYFGQGAGSLSRSAKLDPTGVNKITFGSDGKIASFEVSYYLVQAGAERTHFEEKFTYKGPRE